MKHYIIDLSLEYELRIRLAVLIINQLGTKNRKGAFL